MGPTARTVADNVRRLREARGMSLRTLAVELKRLGRSLSADALNKIENGRTLESGAEPPKQVRRVDMDDLMALAHALRVSPLTLLLPWPQREDDQVEITSIGEASARQAWDWALGLRPPRLSDSDPAGDLNRFLIDSLPPWARPALYAAAVDDATEEQKKRLAAAGWVTVEDQPQQRES